jgi:hypothetical protein
LHEDAENYGRMAISEDDVAVIYFSNCILDEHIICEDDLLLRQGTSL